MASLHTPPMKSFVSPMAAGLQEVSLAERSNDSDRASQALEQLHRDRSQTSARLRRVSWICAAFAVGSAAVFAWAMSRTAGEELGGYLLPVIAGLVTLGAGAAAGGFRREARRTAFESEVVATHAELNRRTFGLGAGESASSPHVEQ